MLTFSIITFILMSCSNENLQNEDNLDSSKISLTLKEKNSSTQKVMYNLLSKEEKYSLWIEKINYILYNKKLNEEQAKLIIDLKRNLNINLFDDNEFNNEKVVFKVVYVKEFLEKASQIFDNEFIYDNFFNIESNLKNRGTPIYFFDQFQSDCVCNASSIYGCSYNYKCKKTDCKFTTSGCGFLFMFECNGTCELGY